MTEDPHQITNNHAGDPDTEIPVESDPSHAAKSTTDPERVRNFAIDVARLLADDKCEHVVVIDVREISQVAGYIVIGSGTSDRQMASALDNAQDLGKDKGFQSWRTSKDDRSTWLLADFVDVVVHLFEPNTRAYYDLETMWGDGHRVEWKRADHMKAGNDQA